ncbi:MAG: DUF4348 domain-containing protein [Prevotella sp.]|nr:DUF4348 domain-containing protein [Prevotella sp.]
MRKTAMFLIGISVLMICCTIGCKDKKPETEVVPEKTVTKDTVPVVEDIPVDTIPDSDRDSLISATPMPKAADELFDDFLFNFTANKKLQYERVKFPLPIKDGDSEDSIEKKDWKIEKFFMEQEFYTLIFDNEKQTQLLKDTTVGHVIIEKIDLRNKRVEQHIFDRENGLWMLTEICRNSTYQNPNKSFLDFYAQFAADSIYQVESMNDEVHAILPDPDDEYNGMIEGVFSPDQWHDFKPVDLPKDYLYNIIYGQKYTRSNEKLLLLRGIANGLESEMTFKIIDGKWKLIKLVN